MFTKPPLQRVWLSFGGDGLHYTFHPSSIE
jgi:hypothetical protein